MAPGFSAYLSTSMNGVTSANYANYGSSYILVSINPVYNLTGGITDQNLTAMKNELKSHYESVVHGLVNEIANLKTVIKNENMLLGEELKKNQKESNEKETKIILKAMQKDQCVCVICMEKERSRVVFPCYHALYCDDCIKGVR